MHLNVVERILICEENNWQDFLCSIDEIIQSLGDNPSAYKAIVAELGFWCDEVDYRYIKHKESEALDESELIPRHPLMTAGDTFGTEV